MEKKEEKTKVIKDKVKNKSPSSNMQSRITYEYNRLCNLFLTKVKEKDHIVKRLSKRAAFLMVLSEIMEKQIKESDLTVETINASQQFTKSNPLLKDYRDTVKSYQTVIKQLCDLVRNESSSDKDKPDELELFLKS